MTRDQLREAVARAIDPASWRVMDQFIREEWPERVRDVADNAVAPSLAKADAALAVAVPVLREHFAGVSIARFRRGSAHTYASENGCCYVAQEYAAEAIAAAIRADEGPK